MVSGLLMQSCSLKPGDTLPQRFVTACNPARAKAVLCPVHAMSQDRNRDVRREAATLDAPAASSSAPYTATYPTEAARRTAFSEDFTPEIIEPVAAEVQGSIPAWLRGSFIRNGPGVFKGMKHLFDGYGMLVKVEISDGTAHVQQRFVDSVAFRAFRETGQVQYPEFGTNTPLLTSLRRAFEGLTGLAQGFTDNSNVSVVPSLDGSELLALTESVAGTHRARTGDLATLGHVQFQDGNRDVLTTAHPSVMEDGSLINLTTTFGTHYTLVRQDRNTDVRTEIAKVPLSRPPMPSWVHDFPVTQNYAVVPETPIFYNLLAALSGGGEYGLFEWDAAARTRLHLVDLRTGAVKQLDAPPYFTFHYINSFETPDGTALCFDLSDFGDPAIINSFLLDNLRSHSRPLPLCSVMRVTVPLDAGATSATMERLMQDDADVPFCELPRVNPANKGKPYRYGYVVSAVLPTCYGNALAKIDVAEGTAKRWHEPGCIPVEPIMVPRPGAQAEDDGAVLAMVTGADGGSFLLILDAASFEEVARVKMPTGLPYGFHGTFIPAQ